LFMSMWYIDTNWTYTTGLWFYWASNSQSANFRYCLSFYWSSFNAENYQYPGWWYHIRPFANTPVQPDDTWTVLYQPS
jgi:hypothetical protein